MLNGEAPSLVTNSGDALDRSATPGVQEAEQDVDVMLASLRLQTIRRYMDQNHWHEESRLARTADEAEPGLKLENVAAHSWHVADATMLLAANFADLDGCRAIQLAILHDKLEIFTGDLDPVGADGQGTTSHAFNPAAQAEKIQKERAALKHYLAQLRAPAREQQKALLLEVIDATSPEAGLVKAVDKLQALAFVLIKKAGDMTDEHLIFSLRYSFKAVESFPRIAMHHAALVDRLLERVAMHRRVTLGALMSSLPPSVRVLPAAVEA